MRLTAAAIVLLAIAAGLWLWLGGGYAQAVHWAIERQHALQNDLARLIGAARRGDPGVVWALIGTAGFYGIAHAAGPGHGKFLLGGAGLATPGSATALAGIALVAALAQGMTAVALVYGGLGLFSLAAGTAVELTDHVLTPLSYLVVAAIGGVLLWRGGRGIWARLAPVRAHKAHHHHHHDHSHGGDDCGCGHRHGPSLEEVQRLRSWRDVAALIGGIAIRPCTGAVMVLVIAWNTGLAALGLAAVAAMALGTGAVTAAVALGAVWLRQSSLVALAGGGRLALVAPALQLFAGGIVLALSLGLLAASV